MKKFSRIEHTNESIKLDAKDNKLLELLVADGRMSVSQLASKVALKRDSVSYRIQKLQDKNIIRGYAPFIDFKALGFIVFHLYLLVSEKPDSTSKLLEYLTKHPNAIRVLEFNDRWDYEVVLAVRSLDNFRDIRNELHEKFGEIIMEEDHIIEVERFSTSYLPLAFAAGFTKDVKPYDADELDLSILKSMRYDARKTLIQVSKEVSADTDTIRKRIKKLEQNNVIHRFGAVVNISRLNYHLYVFNANMRFISERDDMRFRDLVKNSRNIIEIFKTTGDFDVTSYLAAENSHSLNTAIKNFKQEFAHTVTNYQALLVFQEHSFNPAPDAVLQQE